MSEIENLVRKVAEKVPLEERHKSEIEKKLQILVKEFGVPGDEAVRCVVNQLRKDLGITSVPRTAKISDLKNGESVNLNFKVLKIGKANSEKISALLTIGDETGITRAVVLKNATAVAFEVGKCYNVRNALSRDGVLITKSSTVFEINENIKVKPTRFRGAIVGVGKASGFVARCPQCQSIIVGATCKTHGKVKPVLNYEAKIVVDNGEKAITITAKENDLGLLGLSKEEANEIRMNYASNEPVYAELVSRLIGRYVDVEMGETIRILPIKGVV